VELSNEVSTHITRIYSFLAATTFAKLTQYSHTPTGVAGKELKAKLQFCVAEFIALLESRTKDLMDQFHHITAYFVPLGDVAIYVFWSSIVVGNAHIGFRFDILSATSSKLHIHAIGA
jgi:hypothetical protein